MDQLDQVALACEIRASRLAVDWRQHGAYKAFHPRGVVIVPGFISPGVVLFWQWNERPA